MPNVAYNPSDPKQQAFLNAIALGESGGASNAPTLGAGGTDLGGYATDQYGFPQWGGTTGGNGTGRSHGAGIFQFEPGTWKAEASKLGLNFQNPNDQYAGAWDLAQTVYGQKTGGSLEDALNSGDYSSVQSALNGTWGTNGNGSTPHGLAYDLANGIGAPDYGGNGISSSDGSTPDVSGASSSSGGFLDALKQYFVRGGLLLVGGLVLLVALWILLSKQGYVPAPGEVAKTAAEI